MSNTLISVLAIAVVAFAAFLITRRKHTTTELAAQGVTLDPLVGAFVDAFHHCASEVDPPYVKAVATLRERPESSAAKLEKDYRALGREYVDARESVLYAASALAHPAILPLLMEVAQQSGSGSIHHEGGRAAQESILRTVAVDGIDAIARSGDERATNALVALTSSADRAVQASAVVALKYLPTKTAFERLADKLPQDRRYLLNLVRADVREVPQISDPRRHLRAEPSTVDRRPDLNSGQARNGGPAPASARVPQTKGRR